MFAFIKLESYRVLNEEGKSIILVIASWKAHT